MMTHNYERDHDILYKLLNSNCRYIGALGPKLRTEKLIAEIRAEGKTFNEWNLENSPRAVGLDIGAETPEEIALAVVAEIKTALSNRGGGFLRERQGAIND
jgi:xanthine/CO dehydrogenase XdhC/CoxF family maturation factor